MQGKVVFVGGGPGDPELLTIKAYNIIKNADTIIYAGSLVNKDVLKYAKDDAKIYNSAHMDLNEIIKIMEEDVTKNKIVARIHTGDPAIYGAIGEQIRELEKKDIKYDIIPGVSSLFGVASALRTELTLPEISQTVIITRPEGRTPKPMKEQIKELASHEATMCIFLGIHMINKVVEDLLTHYSEDTAVAVVQKATWPEEIIIKGTLKNISKKVEESGITKTAMIVVGNVLNPGDFKFSKLYDANFSHEFRN